MKMDEHTDGEKVEKKTFATELPDGIAIPVGVAMGITFGIVFWTAFDNIGIGIVMGVAFGIVFGLSIDTVRKKEGESEEQ